MGSWVLYDRNLQTQIRPTYIQGAKNFAYLAVNCGRALTMTRHTLTQCAVFCI